MSKPTKIKPQKKESQKEIVARISAENRAYFQKLESKEKKQSRKEVIADITVPRSWLGNSAQKESKPENLTKIRSLFDEYQANKESPAAFYVCPNCNNECSVVSDLIGGDVQCPNCPNIFNAAATKPQTTRSEKPASKQSSGFEALAGFAIIAVCGLLIWWWWIFTFNTNSSEQIQPTTAAQTQNGEPVATTQPNSQTTPESVADFNSRMEAKELIRRRAQEDYGNNSTTPSKYAISSDRAKKYFGSDAREEMRNYLQQNGNSSPSQSDIDFALKLNERLEHNSGN